MLSWDEGRKRSLLSFPLVARYPLFHVIARCAWTEGVGVLEKSLTGRDMGFYIGLSFATKPFAGACFHCMCLRYSSTVG